MEVESELLHILQKNCTGYKKISEQFSETGPETTKKVWFQANQPVLSLCKKQVKWCVHSGVLF